MVVPRIYRFFGGPGSLAGIGHLTTLHGGRGLGFEQDGGLGLGYHQFRLVGGDRSRRHPDFGGTSLVPSKVENGR